MRQPRQRCNQERLERHQGLHDGEVRSSSGYGHGRCLPNVEATVDDEIEVSDEEDDVVEENLFYDVPLYMSEVGDRDELGQYCTAGQRVDEGGPTSRGKIDAVVREALMRGGGDQWTAQEFLNNYSDQNRGKRMYQELTHYTLGFFRTIPTNGCGFHAGLHGYYGVEHGRDYVPDLDPYGRQVSWNLNTGLRHHVGKTGSPWIWIEVSEV